MDIKVQRKLNNFFSKYKSHQYKKKEILIRADDEPAGVFYLRAGVVRMYAVTSAGEELTINVYKPVSFFPMSGVLNNAISHYYFEAMSQVTVWKAPKIDFLKFLKKEPSVVFDLMKRIYLGLEGYFLRMEYLMGGNARARLTVELLIYARRFGEKQGDKTVVSLKLTEKDLASQLGIARETVSREIQKLRKKGLISFQKNTLTVKNLQKLEQELLII